MLAVPMTILVWRAASAKPVRIAGAIDAVGQDQAAEKQHLGRQKNPHAELRHVVLLAQVDKLKCGLRLRHFAARALPLTV